MDLANTAMSLDRPFGVMKRMIAVMSALPDTMDTNGLHVLKGVLAPGGAGVLRIKIASTGKFQFSVNVTPRRVSCSLSRIRVRAPREL